MLDSNLPLSIAMFLARRPLRRVTKLFALIDLQIEKLGGEGDGGWRGSLFPFKSTYQSHHSFLSSSQIIQNCDVVSVDVVFCSSAQDRTKDSLEAWYTEQDFRPSDPGVIHAGILSDRLITLGILLEGLATFPVGGRQHT